MSLDTEGAELDIISAIDFNIYSMGLITVEHNHDQIRQGEIRNVLVNRYGYEVVEVLNKDWFFNRKTISAITKIPSSKLFSPEKIAKDVICDYGIRD